MKIEVLKEIEEVEELAEKWNRLAQQEPRDGAFRSYDWYAAWIKSFAPEAKPYVITARAAGGELVGIAPLYQGEYSDHRITFRALGVGGRELVSGDFLDVLATADYKSEFTARVLENAADENDWEIAVFGELLEDSDSLAAVLRWCARRGYAYHKQERRGCPFIKLPATWDEYLAGVGPNFRSNLRKLGRLRSAGAEVYTWTEGDDLQRELNTLVKLHTARWNAKEEPGTLSQPKLREFLQRLCEFDRSCVLRPQMYSLRKDKETVASLLTFRFGEATYFYQCGWNTDSELAKFRPMLVLLGYSVQRSIEEGLRYYEMLRGEHGYKLRFTATMRSTVTVVVGRSTRARAYCAALKTNDFLKRVMRRPRPELIAQERD